MIFSKKLLRPMLGILSFLFVTFAFAATDPGKSSTKTDPPGNNPGKVAVGYYSNLELSIRANTASTVVNPETNTTTYNSNPFFLAGNDLRTETSLQYSNSSNQLTLVTINTQSRIDGVVYTQTLVLYPQEQERNTSTGVGRATASNIIMEINRAAQLQSEESNNSNSSAPASQPSPTSKSVSNKPQ